jgi:uroporphyrinogen-III synthase
MRTATAFERGPVWVVATEVTARRWSDDMRSFGWTPHPLAWGTARPLATRADFDAALPRVSPDLVLLTSAESLAFLGETRVPGVAAACVGPATASAAAQHGFDVVVSGEGGSMQLAAGVAALPRPPRTVLWLRGRDARPEGAASLRAAGSTVEELVTYAVEPAPGFAAAVRAAPEPAALAVGSPRAAEALADALHAVPRRLPGAVPVMAPGTTTHGRLIELGFGAHPQVAMWSVIVGRNMARYHPPLG